MFVSFKSNTTGVASGAGIMHPIIHQSFIPVLPLVFYTIYTISIYKKIHITIN